MNQPRRCAVLLSSVRWDFVYQRHHAIAEALSAAGYDVWFYNPHPRSWRHLIQGAVRRWRSPAGQARAVAGDAPSVATLSGVRVRPGWAAMFPKRELRFMRRHGMTEPVDLLLLYLPSRTFVDFGKLLGARLGIYDHVIDWAAAPTSWHPPKNWRAIEHEAVQPGSGICLKIVSDSPELVARWRSLDLEASLMLPAADEVFRTFPWSDPEPREVALGYFGTVRQEEIDVHYLVRLAEKFRVCVAGPVDSASLRLLQDSSVELLGNLPPDRLVHAMDQWSHIVLPYRRTARTATLMPAKLGNALATRRPIFARNLVLPAELARRVHELPEVPTDFPVTVRRAVDGHDDGGWTDRLRRSGFPV